MQISECTTKRSDTQQDNRKRSMSLQSWRQELNISTQITPQHRFDSLTKSQYWAYGVGHFINDLTSACWFNYLLYYLDVVVKVRFGPYSVLSGQVADALATPFVGYLSDRTNTKIGKRIPWYIGGYIVLLLTFIPLWSGCFLCEWFPSQQGIQIFYYIFFPAVFNFGWASIQISHMSLVPSLSCGKSRRDSLNSLRNTFSFLAILFVYCTSVIILALFQIIEDPFVQFKYLSYIAMAVGSLTSIFFLIKINEPKLTSECTVIAYTLKQLLLLNRVNTQSFSDQRTQNTFSGSLTCTVKDSNISILKEIRKQQLDPDSSVDHIELSPNLYLEPSQDNFDQTNVQEKMKSLDSNKSDFANETIDWTQWFKEFQFYRYGLVYAGVRLYCNVTSTMITFYLITVLNFQQKNSIKTPIQIALIPLSLYLMSALTSGYLDRIYKRFGKKQTFTIGASLCVGTSTCFIFLTPETKNLMYLVAPVIGVAQAINLNTGITLISDVIGLRGSSGAFVFGFYSFLDKISAGIVLFLCTNSSNFNNPDYIRWVMILVPSLSCVFAWFMVVLPMNQDYVEDCLVNDTNKESLNGKKRLACLSDELVS